MTNQQIKDNDIVAYNSSKQRLIEANGAYQLARKNLEQIIKESINVFINLLRKEEHTLIPNYVVCPHDGYVVRLIYKINSMINIGLGANYYKTSIFKKRPNLKPLNLSDFPGNLLFKDYECGTGPINDKSCSEEPYLFPENYLSDYYYCDIMHCKKGTIPEKHPYKFENYKFNGIPYHSKEFAYTFV